MADYWKSTPKYYCQYCKCYMADNAATISRHEQGSKHKMNKEQRLQSIREKAMQDEKERVDKDSLLRQMNEGAMQSMMADLSNPALVKKYGNDSLQSVLANRMVDKPVPKTTATGYATIAGVKPVVGPTALPSPAAEPVQSKWIETKTPGGASYYWNVDTEEVSWTLPVPETLPTPEEVKAEERQKQKTKITLFHQKKLAELGHSLPTNDKLPESSTATTSISNNYSQSTTSLIGQSSSNELATTATSNKPRLSVQQIISSQIVSGYGTSTSQTGKWTTVHTETESSKSTVPQSASTKAPQEPSFQIKEREIPKRPAEQGTEEAVVFKRVKQAETNRVRISGES